MFKRFISYYKPHKLIFSLDMGASLIVSVIGIFYIVIGRGLLANPALAAEYRQGEPLSADEKGEKLCRFHAELFSQYGNLLQGGDLQLLNKMKTVWEYLLPDADRKARKAIHKATRLDTYQTAVNQLLRG